MRRWIAEVELAFYAGMCMFFSMLGTRLKWRSRDVREGEKSPEPFDRRKYISGLYLAAGAGLTTGLLGQGLHINSSFLMGASIVIGYAGGKPFLDWTLKLLKRYFDGDSPKLRETLEKVISEVKKDDNDNEEKDGDPL